jgi:hypothetical protein
MDAKLKLDSAIAQAADAITQGRDAVQGLRESTSQGNDIAQALRTLGEELANDSPNRPTAAFHVSVEGEARNLHPMLCGDIYKIAMERCATPFATQMHNTLWLKFALTMSNFDCVSATMEKASIQRCSPGREGRRSGSTPSGA